jgi:hypothetical protein
LIFIFFLLFFSFLIVRERLRAFEIDLNAGLQGQESASALSLSSIEAYLGFITEADG